MKLKLSKFQHNRQSTSAAVARPETGQITKTYSDLVFQTGKSTNTVLTLVSVSCCIVTLVSIWPGEQECG